MEKPEADKALKRIIFVAPVREGFFKVFDQVTEGSPIEIASPIAAFRRNLESAMNTAGMPFYLVGMSLRYSIANLYKRMTGEDEIDFDSIADEESAAQIRRWKELAAREDVQPSLVEHLRQSTVLLWGTLEAFAIDLFVDLLNAKPELTSKLIDNQTTRKWFDLKTLQFEDLISYDYGLSTKMGEFLNRRYAIDSFVAIKEVFSTILPSSELLSEILTDRRLRLLNHRRHVIVHRCSVIDQEYLDKTGDQLEAGSELIITSHDYNSYLHSVLEAGTALTYGARRLFVDLPFDLRLKEQEAGQEVLD